MRTGYCCNVRIFNLLLTHVICHDTITKIYTAFGATTMQSAYNAYKAELVLILSITILSKESNVRTMRVLL